MLNYQHGGFVRWSAWYGIRLRNFQHILVQIIIIVFIGCCKFFYAYGAPRKETSFYWNIQQKYSQEKSREFTNLAIVIENPTIRPNWNINLTDYPNIRILRYWKNMHKQILWRFLHELVLLHHTRWQFSNYVLSVNIMKKKLSPN